MANSSTPSQRTELSAAKRSLLEKRLHQAALRPEPSARIPRQAARTGVPLAFAQEPLWFIHQLDPASPAYHVPTAVRLTGDLDLSALERALNLLQERHEILRTTFPAVDGRPTQQIGPAQPRSLPVVDLRRQAPADRQAQLDQFLRQEAHRPFDLAHGPLLRWAVVRCADREHVLLLVMHHIVSDGWSIGVLFRDLEALYHAARRDQPPSLPPLPIQYADFAQWQRESLAGDGLQRHLAYWKEKLAGAPPALDLPTAHPRPARTRQSGGTVTLNLPPEVCTALRAACENEGVTTFMLLLAALAIVLGKWTRQNDLVIGTVVAGRTRRELEGLVGCFMNFLPLRTRLRDQDTAGDVLAQVKSTVLEAGMHQDCPFEKIVETLNPARRLNQNPLFNVALLLQNYPTGIFTSDGLSATYLPVDTDAALLDLRLVAEETERELTIACEYDVDLFQPATLQHLLASFRQALDLVVAAPETALSAFQLPPPLLAQGEATPAVRDTLAVAATFTAEPLEETLAFWLRELEWPAAVRFAPYNQVFQQLLEPASLLNANSRGLNLVLVRLEDLAGRSAGATATAGDPAGEIERNTRDLLAALKTAAARSATPWLVCLCPASKAALAQPERMEFLRQLEEFIAAELQAVNGVHLIRPEELLRLYPVAEYDDPHADRLGHIPYSPAFFVALGTLLVRRGHALRRPPRKVIVLDCDQTLWGGVCGEDGPRGVTLDAPRRELQEFMRRQHDAGMLLCLCSKNNPPDVEEVFACRPEMPLRREHFAARRINWRPKSENLRALARELQLGLDSFVLVDDNPMECAEVEANCPEVIALQLPEDPARIPEFLQHVWVFDHLKLTAEDRGRTAQYHQNRLREQLQAESPSLADFLAGLQLEIAIEEARADQLPRLAQLTQRTNQFNCTTRRLAEAEVAKRWREGPAKLLAVSVRDRFGDYGLVGAVSFAAVRDALVVDLFLLSCRVLGKGVEHRVLAHLGQTAQTLGLRRVDIQFLPSARNKPALDFLSAVGSAFRQGTNGSYVFHFPAEIAAAVAFDGQSPEAAPESEPARPPASVAEADGELPAARFKRYGWIATHARRPDQIAQCLLARARQKPAGGRPDYLAPETDLQRQLCALWQEVLRVERVGIHDDFFALGGTSLLAVRLFAQLETVMGRKLPLVTLFEAPTVAHLANLLGRKPPRGARSSLVAIQPKGSKPPLILVHGAGGGILWGYTNLAAHLGADQPLFGIEPRGRGGLRAPTVEGMAELYVRELQAFQPKGPYYLGGYCFGGYIAYEMARRLAQLGERVALVALIDSAAPNGSYERVPWWRPGFYPAFARNCVYWLRDFTRLSPETRREFIRRKRGVWQRQLRQRLRGAAHPPAAVDLEEFIDVTKFPEQELALWQMHLRAGTLYTPQRYAGRVTLIRTRGQPFLCSFDPQYGWRELADGGVEVRLVPGSHENIFVEPDVHALARELRAALQAAQDAAAAAPTL